MNMLVAISYSESYVTVDGNGNILTLVNSSDGSTVASYEYSPFGECIKAQGSLALENKFRFSTKYTDDEIGLIYYGYRYYDAKNGRWVSRDLIGERGGINLYGFVENDGVNYFDYLGLFKYSTDEINGQTKSGGKIDPNDPNSIGNAMADPQVSLLKWKGTIVGGCKCCISELEFALKVIVYLPIVGEKGGYWLDPPGNSGERKHYDITLEQKHIDALRLHENAHVWGDMKLGYAIFPKAENECKGKCWEKSSGTYTQGECDNLVKAKAQSVIDYYHSIAGQVGGIWHKILGDDSSLVYPERLSQQNIKIYQDAVMKWVRTKSQAKKFCADGR